MAISTGALLGAAGIGAAGSLLSGLFGSSSQRSANETNIQIARETNQMNRDLFNQSLAWQEDMWNKTKDYNSPANQVKLMKEAGINPASGFGQMSDVSMPSVPSAPQMQSAHVNPIDYSWMGNIVDRGVNAYLNNQILSNQVVKSAADSQIAKANAEFDTLSLQDRLRRVAADSSKSEYERDSARLSMEVLEGTKRYNIMQAEKAVEMTDRQIQELDARIVGTKLANEIATIDLNWKDRINSAQYNQFQALIAQAYASARNSDASSALAFANEALSKAQEAGVKVDNETKRKVQKAVISKVYNEADQSVSQSRFMRARNKYGEARVRLIGTEGKQVPETPLEKGVKKVAGFYDRGVNQGVNKVRKRRLRQP